MKRAFIRRAAAAIQCIAAITVVASCASTGAAGSGSGGNVSRREERVVIGSFAEVQAVAASRRFVFAGTPSGIAVYDRSFQRWMPPLTQATGFANQQITAIAADPTEDALWYGVPGAIVVYRPQVDQVQSTTITGVPDLIAFDRGGSGDVYVRASGQWTRMSRTGFAQIVNSPPPASRLFLPVGLNDVYRQFPTLRSQLSFLMRSAAPNRSMRNYAPISGTISPDRTTEAWIGTNGDGLWKVDPTFQQGTPLRFGPMDVATGALALAANGVWMAGLGTSTQRGGISFGSDDLQQWDWIEGTISVPMVGVRAHAMSVRGQRAWVATDRGLYRVHLDGNQDISVWSTLDGMPADRILSVAARSDGAWAGTERGLVWVSDTTDVRDRRTRGIGRSLLDNTPVRALQAIGDTLWIGTDAGLVALLGQSATLARPISDDPAFRRPVRALAWSDSILLVATDNDLLRVAPRGGYAPTRMDIDIRSVGQVTRIAIDERTIWVAGTDGVLVVQRSDGLIRQMRVGYDLPGAALDVVASHEWLWIATTNGIVRVHRNSQGGLP